MNIGLFITATGKYIEFLPKLFASAEKYFMEKKDVSLVIFTDHEHIPDTKFKTILNKVEKTEFPFATMNRCKYYSQFMANNSKMFDYCYAIDADAYFADYVNKSILFNSIAVRHCAFINKRGTFETNPQSSCFIPENYQGPYLGGGFYGGDSFSFYYTNKFMNNCIQHDLKKGITPIWHDESALNRYFFEHAPEQLLGPGYHYAGWDKEKSLNPYIKSLWEKEEFYIKSVLKETIPISPKIIFVEKTFENKGVDYYRS